jgi:hypothetical protein
MTGRFEHFDGRPARSSIAREPEARARVHAAAPCESRVSAVCMPDSRSVGFQQRGLCFSAVLLGRESARKEPVCRPLMPKEGLEPR